MSYTYAGSLFSTRHDALTACVLDYCSGQPGYIENCAENIWQDMLDEGWALPAASVTLEEIADALDAARKF